MGSSPQSHKRRFDAFDVDLHTGEVYKLGIRLKLQDQPFRVLAFLLERPGDVVTREELRQRLWPADTFVDFDTGLNSAIKKLRGVLGDSPEKPRYIETLPRRGYRFIGSLETASFPSLPAAPETTPDRLESEPVSIPLNAALKMPRRHGRLLLALALSVAALAMAAFVALAPRARSGAHPASVKSLAVLPLENLTGDPSQEYFADGMTDAVITELAQVRGLRVISRTSVMHYKGARRSLKAIAKELNVDAVVEGTVARSDEEVKVTAQLIHASTDAHLWAASYTRPRQDILGLQADIAREVARQIGNHLQPPGGKSKAKPVSVVNPEAYDAYLKGVFFQNKGSPDALKTAIRYLESAIEKDPDFAAAYSSLSDCYVTLAFLSEMPSTEAYQAAKLAAQKAVALNDNLDKGHVALAWIAISDWDWTRAEAEYRRAIQLNPNSVDAHIGYFYLLLILGRTEEAVEHEQAAGAADPLSPNIVGMRAFSAYLRRQYKDGLTNARDAVELYPQVSAFHDLLSNFYAAHGNDKLSGEQILLAEETAGATPERLAALRAANEAGGPQALRRKRIELNKKMASKQAANAYDIAIDSAAIGDGEQAIAWLERASQARDPKIYLIGVEPIFDGLRSDPRFVRLLNRMGFGQTRSGQSAFSSASTS